jgi:mycothione reductase
MKTYDIIVIGSGAGNIVADQALNHNFTVALIDRGPIGGTCLNLGCIPSKMLMYPADRIMEIREASRLGITAEILSVDFSGIMERMRHTISRYREKMTRELKQLSGLDFYEEEAHFIDDYTLNVGKDKIKGHIIVIAVGASPKVPPVQGLEEIDYLTNESLLDLTRSPESLIIIGGGYIAVEYGHFFAAMGTDVTLLETSDRLVQSQEPEVSELLERKLGSRINLHTNTEAVDAYLSNGLCTVIGKDKNHGRKKRFKAQRILVASGRMSNASGLKVANTGIDMDDRGYILTNQYLETSKKNIWALGDITGRGMFRHAANYEASVVIESIFHGTKRKMDYSKVPHAVFTYPEIASVGLTESEAIERFGADALLTEHVKYGEVARGEAMMEKDGFAKVIVHKDRGTVAGFHIIGPHASILIQEVVNAMAGENGLSYLKTSMHIHPALTEIIQNIFRNIGSIR